MFLPGRSHHHGICVFILMLLISGCRDSRGVRPDLNTIDRERILLAADSYLKEIPETVTASLCARSAGGRHDFYSEGDYWWPDPNNPEGPYIRRDGMSNPDNFTEHRRVMVRLSIQVPTLVAAYLISNEILYAEHARRHLRTWFIDPETRMTPALNFAQAISGWVTGRGVGIIDTIHLVEVAQAILKLESVHAIPSDELITIKAWFAEYLKWMTNHEYGIDEMKRKNNHGTCWVMQVAAFARLVGDDELMQMCRDRVKSVLVPNQIASDGSFQMELDRTKPYGYSLFNLDAFAAVCLILSTPEDNLWEFRTTTSGSMADALAYMFSFIDNKSIWPLAPDVMYFDKFPVRHPALLFGGIALNRSDYINLWSTLDPDPETTEVIRNYPIRQPILWVD